MKDVCSYTINTQRIFISFFFLWQAWHRKMNYAISLCLLKKERTQQILKGGVLLCGACFHKYPTCFSAHSSNFRWLTSQGFMGKWTDLSPEVHIFVYLHISSLLRQWRVFPGFCQNVLWQCDRAHWKKFAAAQIGFALKILFRIYIFCLLNFFNEKTHSSPWSPDAQSVSYHFISIKKFWDLYECKWGRFSFSCHIVLWAVIILNLHTACTCTESLQGCGYREMGANLQFPSTFWSFTLAWFCQVQCVEMPMDQITNEFWGRTDKMTMNIITIAPAWKWGVIPWVVGFPH